MASYNGLSENINTTNFDNQKILKDLEQLEITITYLNSYPPTELSDDVKSKIHLLVTSFHVLQSRLFRSRVSSKTLDELWEGNAMLKYLFEKCIQYYDVNNRLKCTSCNEWLPLSRDELKKHLESCKHVRCFSENMFRDIVTYWRDISCSTSDAEDEGFDIDDDKCLMLKYGRFVDFDGPNDMLFCKVCCIAVPKNTNNLRDHFKDSLHQDLFKEVASVIVGRTKNNIEKTKNKNIFFNNQSDSSMLVMSFNNLQPLVNTNLEIPTGSLTIPNQSTEDESREEMKNWFSDTIDKFVIEFLADESPCSKLYICSLCQLRTTSFTRWQEHCFSVIHETRMKFSNNISYCPCNCSMEIICPQYIREFHMEKNHDRLLTLFEALQSKQQSHAVLKKSPTYSDDENVSSDDNNKNNNSDSGSSDAENNNFNLDLKSKITNAEKSSIKPKNANGINTNNGERKNVPQHSAKPSSKKNKNIIEEKNPATLQNSARLGTPIGLSDIPNDTSDDDLIRVIQHFGSINKIERMSPSFANVYIDLRDEFQSILFLGLTVKVKGSEVRITDPLPLSTSEDGASYIPTPKSNFGKFDKEVHFAELINVQINRSELACNKSEMVRHDLTVAVSHQTIIVGSKALFLATDPCSTLDLFINIDDNFFGKKNEVTAVELSTRTTKLFMMLIKSELFKNVEIAGDNVQVLLMQHKDTDMKCRIFCKDGLIVEKTFLSKVYLNCDMKIRHMVLTLLDWFDEVGLRNILPTYSILWMALFPLMTNFYLHPVTVLRKHNSDGRMMISGWDCRYSKRFNPKVKDLPSAYELAYLFFHFYSDIDNFDRKVLAPLTGESFDQQRVRQRKLPPAYNRYHHLISTKAVRFFKLTNGLCLQDPLQLNYNLTKSLQGNSLNKFVAACKETLSCFDQKSLSTGTVQRFVFDH